MKYYWINQGSFLFESQDFRLSVDPYLSDFVEKKEGLTRLAQAGFTVKSLKPDFVFCTHNHIDHLDPIAIPEITEEYPECVIAGPNSVMEKCGELNIAESKLLTVNEGESINAGPFKCTALPAIHSDKDAVGLLIEVEGKKIFLSADSEYTTEYAEAVKSATGEDVDLILVCINGRWGNMNSDEALTFTQQLKAKKAHPMHYGLFAENTANPEPFIRECRTAGIESFGLEIGTCYEL